VFQLDHYYCHVLSLRWSKLKVRGSKCSLSAIDTGYMMTCKFLIARGQRRSCTHAIFGCLSIRSAKLDGATSNDSQVSSLSNKSLSPFRYTLRRTLTLTTSCNGTTTNWFGPQSVGPARSRPGTMPRCVGPTARSSQLARRPGGSVGHRRHTAAAAADDDENGNHRPRHTHLYFIIMRPLLRFVIPPSRPTDSRRNNTTQPRDA